MGTPPPAVLCIAIIFAAACGTPKPLVAPAGPAPARPAPAQTGAPASPSAQAQPSAQVQTSAEVQTPPHTLIPAPVSFAATAAPAFAITPRTRIIVNTADAVGVGRFLARLIAPSPVAAVPVELLDSDAES